MGAEHDEATQGAQGADESTANATEGVGAANAASATELLGTGADAAGGAGDGDIGASAADEATTAYERAIAERDAKIAELQSQVAEAAQSAESAKALNREIAALKKQAADERVDFHLQLAGCRNTKAARAVLSDYDGDIEAMKAAEPWLFADGRKATAATGATGLPNAGAATDEAATMARWREIAGLTEDDGR